MQDKDLELLESLEARDAALRRRAAWSAWGAVLLAALVLIGLIALSYRQLESSQREVGRLQREAAAERDSLEALRAEKQRLETEIANLEPIVENYQAIVAPQSAADLRAEVRISPVEPPGDTGEGGGGTRLQPRAYLHIVREQDRSSAKRIGEELEKAGFVALGVEYVPRAARLKNTEVRYYKRAEREGAEKLVEALRAAGVKSPGLLYLNLENNRNVRPNHYEVWFAAGLGRDPVEPAEEGTRPRREAEGRRSSGQ